MSRGDRDYGKKATYFERLVGLLEEYPKILLVHADNVGSNQMHKIRISLRGKGVILMGKNTMMRKAIRKHIEVNPAVEKLLPHIVGNIGFVFTKDDLLDIRQLVLGERVPAAAKAGSTAPIDVFVEPQNTGMGPEKTNFFQALGIATKITKGSIEILNLQHVVKKDEKVGFSEAQLLTMLKILPFTFGLVLMQVYDNGSCFSPEILDITDEALMAYLAAGIRNVAAFSMAANLPNSASIPHYVINGYKNVLAVSLATEYTFPLAQKIKDFLADPSAFATAAPVAAAGGAAPAAAAAKAEEPAEESDEDMGFGLFD